MTKWERPCGYRPAFGRFRCPTWDHANVMLRLHQFDCVDPLSIRCTDELVEWTLDDIDRADMPAMQLVITRALEAVVSTHRVTER